ncbi:helix-turn-helix domain-containing protein [Leptolyngbya sp. 7M]|uniref:helix-turn-helix domain-containing protein n=1 Tax=Leptolyngbya sp. 7M TaxID=2812896 RepID=UPI001B8B4127|nr:RodZ family helix-turn-helix domain-containing protein [Leptolyngbya sp. 7M]QYO62765.1 helix-turn-helix domain-containing protein [Leptolyngbya sp. 7M]
MKTMARDVSHLQQEQVERLMQIGAYLRHVREEGGLSLEDVAARTLIQPRLLKAIEEGKLHQLPEPVYVQGFIRRYAEAMGLDGVEFAEAFPAEKSLQIAPSSWKDSPAAQLRPLHLYIAYIVLIMASVSLLSYIVGRSATAPSSVNVRPGNSPSTQAIVPTTPPATNPSNQQGAATGSPTSRSTANRARNAASDKPVRVEVKLTAQSWLEVETDGEVKLAEVLPEGTERTWTADKQVRIRAGNAGGVTIAHNGGKAEQMGAPGAVEEKTFASTQTSSSASSTESTEESQSTEQN